MTVFASNPDGLPRADRLISLSETSSPKTPWIRLKLAGQRKSNSVRLFEGTEERFPKSQGEKKSAECQNSWHCSISGKHFSYKSGNRAYKSGNRAFRIIVPMDTPWTTNNGSRVSRGLQRPDFPRFEGCAADQASARIIKSHKGFDKDS